MKYFLFILSLTLGAAVADNGWTALQMPIPLQMPGQFKKAEKFAPLPLPKEPEITREELSAAQGMERLLVENMVQEMRKSIPENEFMPASHAEKVFQQMLDSEYSKAISESGSIGIAELVIAQMRGKR